MNTRIKMRCCMSISWFVTLFNIKVLQFGSWHLSGLDRFKIYVPTVSLPVLRKNRTVSHFWRARNKIITKVSFIWIIQMLKAIQISSFSNIFEYPSFGKHPILITSSRFGLKVVVLWSFDSSRAQWLVNLVNFDQNTIAGYSPPRIQTESPRSHSHFMCFCWPHSQWPKSLSSI